MSTTAAESRFHARLQVGRPILEPVLGREVVAGAKARPSPRSTITRTELSRRTCSITSTKTQDHLRIERIQLVGTIERDRGDGAVDIETDPFKGIAFGHRWLLQLTRELTLALECSG